MLPPGLDMSGSGAISGTPSTTGTFQFAVQVSDTGSPTRIDGKWLSITVQTASNANLPVITRVKVKGDKKLWVYGLNLSTVSVVVVNGVTFTPKWVESDVSLTKGKFNLGPQGTNVVFVVTIFNNSVPFIF
jgi:hypothetical protein